MFKAKLVSLILAILICVPGIVAAMSSQAIFFSGDEGLELALGDLDTQNIDEGTGEIQQLSITDGESSGLDGSPQEGGQKNKNENSQLDKQNMTNRASKNDTTSASSDSSTSSSPGTVSTAKKHCSGSTQTPDGVCKTLKSIKANPTASNSLIIEQAKKTIASLPKVTGFSYSQNSWLPYSNTLGVISAKATVAVLGTRDISLTLEKRSSTWYAVDIIIN